MLQIRNYGIPLIYRRVAQTETDIGHLEKVVVRTRVRNIKTTITQKEVSHIPIPTLTVNNFDIGCFDHTVF